MTPRNGPIAPQIPKGPASAGSRNSFPFRATFCVAALACLLVFISAGPLHGRDYDVGAIVDMTEGNIYVKGNRGTHVLETFEPCLWCEVGLEVLVRFEGFTRATIAPYSKSVFGGPVRVFVIKDGRDEDWRTVRAVLEKIVVIYNACRHLLDQWDSPRGANSR